MKKVLIWSGVIAVLTGAGLYIAYQAKLAQKLLYSFNTLRVLQISKSLLRLSLNVAIENTTELDVEVTGIKMDIYVNNVFVTTATSNVSASIKPNKTTNLPIELSINPADIWDDASQLLFGSASLAGVSFEMKGKVKVNKFGLPLSIPVKYKTTLGEFL